MILLGVYRVEEKVKQLQIKEATKLEGCSACKGPLGKFDYVFCQACKTPKRFNCVYCGFEHAHYQHFCKGKKELYNVGVE